MLSDSASLGSANDSIGSQNPRGGQGPASGELHKANSQMSISQLSTTGVKPDIEVPELSYGLNPRMPSASSAIDLRFSPDKGRYFVATQDLSPGMNPQQEKNRRQDRAANFSFSILGDVVLREEPYAAVLESIFRVNHCAHCLKKTPTPIPCYQCATVSEKWDKPHLFPQDRASNVACSFFQVQYCSESCRDLSWGEYHRIECGILGYLEPSRYLGRMPHLALRCVYCTDCLDKSCTLSFQQLAISC